jgi:hypothetical protein
MIRPVHIKLAGQMNTVKDDGLSAWLKPAKNSGLGLPAPVVSLLNDLNNKRMVLNES